MKLPFRQTKFLNAKYGLWLLLLWQVISVYLMSIGAWPPEMVWITIALAALYSLAVSPYHTALLLISSIPFYTVIPNHYSESLSSWRILFVWAFVVWVGKYAVESYKVPPADIALNAMRSIRKLLFPWDRYAAAVFVIMAISVTVARFPEHSVKQILFVVNAYLLYIIIAASVRTKTQLIEMVKYSAFSAAVIVILGYGQLLLTFFMKLDFFWQYWAINVSSVYYGFGLSRVLGYSNSWFSYSAGAPELRMFSIMPDSHSFAVVAMFLTGFLLALIPVYYRKDTHSSGMARFLPSRPGYVIWNSIRLAGLSIILSGTRGVWVGMLPPLAISVWWYVRRLARPIMKRLIISFALIILFFALSPFINQLLNFLRVSSFEENFLERAATIYDLKEESNIGRLVIWKDSLKYAAAHPFGVGFGNFVVSVVQDVPPAASYEQIASQNNLRYNLPQQFVTAHNLYLHILVELGLVGLVAFILFWLKYFYHVYAYFKGHHSGDTFRSSFVLSVAFIFLWLLAYSMFDVTLFNDKILMYLFISLALSGLIIKGYVHEDPWLDETERH